MPHKRTRGGNAASRQRDGDRMRRMTWKSKIFALQAFMRCLRASGDRHEEGQFYLPEENTQIINDELQQNFRLAADDLVRPEKDSKRYEARVRKKRISLARGGASMTSSPRSRMPGGSVVVDDWNVEHCRNFHTEETMILLPGAHDAGNLFRHQL